MPEQIALNIDCMEYMKTVPDKYFDLAVVDPPYGDGNGGKANRYGESTCSHSVNVERESKSRSITDSVGGSTDASVTRTGGTWAEKYGKKSLRGTLPQGKNTFGSFSASHASKSYGAGIISVCRQHAVLSYGKRQTFRKTFLCQCVNMPGQALTTTQKL